MVCQQDVLPRSPQPASGERPLIRRLGSGSGRGRHVEDEDSARSQRAPHAANTLLKVASSSVPNSP